MNTWYSKAQKSGRNVCILIRFVPFNIKFNCNILNISIEQKQRTVCMSNITNVMSDTEYYII